MANKKTQRDYFNEIKTLCADNDGIVAFCEERIAALDKKSANRKPTKVQAENEDIKTAILEVLGKADKPVTVSEIIKSDERFSGFTPQKVSALLIQLGDKGTGEVVKSVEKRVSYFALAK